MRMRRLLIGMAAALLGTGLAWAEPLPFDVTTATEQSVAHEEVVDAVIEAVQQATVSSQGQRPDSFSRHRAAGRTEGSPGPLRRGGSGVQAYQGHL